MNVWWPWTLWWDCLLLVIDQQSAMARVTRVDGNVIHVDFKRDGADVA